VGARPYRGAPTAELSTSGPGHLERSSLRGGSHASRVRPMDKLDHPPARATVTLFRGLSAFPLTPADADGRVDAAAFGQLLARLGAAGVDSVTVLGSTGTFMYLRREERRRAVETAVERLNGRAPVIAGVGALRTDDAVALAQDARAAGADAVLLAPVSYTPLTDAEVYEHFATVAGATDLPLCIYNNPTTTRFTVGETLLARLATVPNIVAAKMPLPAGVDVSQELTRLRALLPPGFSVGYSGDWGCADALLAGADAWFSVVGGLLPEPAVAMTRAAQAADVAEVRRLNARFEPLWSLLREFGGVRVMYAAAHALGSCRAEPPRPILPLSEADQARVLAAVAALT